MGLTAYAASVYRAYQIAQIHRKRGIPTVMGGIHVSTMPDEAQRFFDAVVIGEAEAVWPEVLEDFESGNLQIQCKGSWADLNVFPLPRRNILKSSNYRWGSIQTSPGRPIKCAFCSVTAFNGRRFPRRPSDAISEELEHILQKWALFINDNIIG